MLFACYSLDCEQPIVSCPTDQTFECDGSDNNADLVAWIAKASAKDNCDADLVVSSEVFNTMSDCGRSNTTVYEFTATDEANNSSTCTASFIIKDRVAPTLLTPAVNLTVDCGTGADNNSAFIAWLNNNGRATASDVCSDLSWSHNYTEALTDLCGSTGARTVTFTARDECGNVAMTTAVFRINDIIDPVIDCPVAIILECGDVLNDAVIANWLSSATATDECSEVTIINDYDANL